MNDARRRILLFIPTLGGGGAERFFVTLLRYLDRGRFELHLALISATGEYMQDVPSDVTIHDLHCSRARYAPARLIPLVRRLKPNAVLSTLGNANVALALSAPLLPRVTKLLLSEAAITSANLPDTGNSRLWGWLIRRFYGRADTVVCLCDSMIEDMVRNFKVPREKLARIYYPVDVERVRTMSGKGESPYTGTGPHLVAAGRLCHQKGFDLLLRAFPDVLKVFPAASLTILGQGPLASELWTLTERLGIKGGVRFEGFQQNPWLYFKHADLFVLPSRWEGLPNVVLEALAAGTSIVATDCPSAIRELQSIFHSIVLVPPESPGDLATAVIAACARSRGAKSEQQVLPELSRFSVSQIVSEYSNLFLT